LQYSCENNTLAGFKLPACGVTDNDSRVDSVVAQFKLVQVFTGFLKFPIFINNDVLFLNFLNPFFPAQNCVLSQLY
jgi:hypothetical protein